MASDFPYRAQVSHGTGYSTHRVRVVEGSIISNRGCVFDLVTGRRVGLLDHAASYERVVFNWRTGTSGHLIHLHKQAKAARDAERATDHTALVDRVQLHQELERAVVDAAKGVSHSIREDASAGVKRDWRKVLYRAVDALEEFEQESIRLFSAAKP